MADYFVSGAGTPSSPYASWENAANDLATVLALATTAGDRVFIDAANPGNDKELSASTTFTVGANIFILASTNGGGTSVSLTTMGTSQWIGNSTTQRNITIAGAYQVYMYGITFRTAGSVTVNISFGNSSSDGMEYTAEDCYFWAGNTNSTARIIIGPYGVNSINGVVRLINPTFRFAHASQGVQCNGRTEIIGGSVSGSGTSPTSLFPTAGVNTSGPFLRVCGLDFTNVATNAVGDWTNASGNVELYGCKFPSSFSLMASQTAKAAGADVYAFDCWSGDEHWHFAHQNALGSTVAIASTESGAIYRTSDGAKYDGTNKVVWKIVGNSDASYNNPYRSPWIEVYHSGTSAITPYLEILRDGSTTDYQNDQVWSEWLAKTTSGQAISSFYTDKRALLSSAADQDDGSGLGDWSGESGSAWSGKLCPTASFTPAELGMIAARVVVAGAHTVWVDPTIRGRT